jgi:hypothetical protein
MEAVVAVEEEMSPRIGQLSEEEPPVWFGRRQAAQPPAPVLEAEPPPAAAPRLPPGAAIVELRALCLAEMDPTSLAKLTPEELTQEVERTLAEIATQRRIQLNGREQRALARELVNDMLGLGPLEPLLEDDAITDIMVNGPEKVFVERRGTSTGWSNSARSASRWRACWRWPRARGATSSFRVARVPARPRC